MPYSLRQVRTGASPNWGEISVPAFDAFYLKMGASYYGREEIMRQANLAIIDSVYDLVYPYGESWRFWWPWVKGYDGETAVGLMNGFIFKHVWVDQELKKAMGY